jgi:hypothetical protein
MKNPFKKIKIPGPESESEKRSQEVDQLMSDWYCLGNKSDLTRLDRLGNWRIVLIGFIAFILVSAFGLVSIYWMIEGKTVPLQTEPQATPDSLLLDIRAPAKIDSGDTVVLIITYQNISKVRLTDLNLNVFYPDNFVFLESSDQEPQNSDQNFWRLPSLEPQSSRKLKIKGQILGASQEIKQVRAILMYKPTNFHSTFKREARAEFRINKSVLAVSLDAPDNLLPDQEVELKVLVQNTSENSLEDIRVRLSLPEKLAVKSMSEQLAENVWFIDQIAPDQRRILEIKGSLTAQPGELAEFRAEVGLDQEGRFVLQNQDVIVAGVIEPEVDLSVELVPDSDLAIQDDQVIGLRFGQSMAVRAIINNLSTLMLEDGILDLKIDDNQNVLVWDSLRVLEDYTYEVVSKASGMAKNEKIVRLQGFGAIPPVQEIIINFSFDLIEVPYDIGASEFAVKILPSFRAASPDLSVPIEAVGKAAEFDINKHSLSN